MVLYVATFCLFELVLVVVLVIVVANTDLDNAKEQNLAVSAGKFVAGLGPHQRDLCSERYRCPLFSSSSCSELPAGTCWESAD